jgi:hypothetical protein
LNDDVPETQFFFPVYPHQSVYNDLGGTSGDTQDSFQQFLADKISHLPGNECRPSIGLGKIFTGIFSNCR